MLNKNIHKAYYEGVKTFQDAAEIVVLAKSTQEPVADRYEAQPVVHLVSGADFISKKEFAEEIFGPATLLVICKDDAELQRAGIAGRATNRHHPCHGR